MDKIIGNNGRNMANVNVSNMQHQGMNRQPRQNPNQPTHHQYNQQQPGQQQRQRVPQNSQPQQRPPGQVQRQHPPNMSQSTHNPAQNRPVNQNRGVVNRPPGQHPNHRPNGMNNNLGGQQHRPQQLQRPTTGQNSPNNQARPQGQSGQPRPNPNNNNQSRPNPNSNGQQRPNQQGNGPNPPPGPPLPNVLPKGWKREEIVRTKGLSAGLVDVVYIPSANAADLPPGKKFKSKLELHRYFGNRYDMSLLDYRSGKLSQVNWRKARRNKSLAANNTNYASAAKYDNYLNLPIRQTASIFKQSVTYKTNNHKNEPTPSHVLNPPANKVADKPKPSQLFWEMRFNNLMAVDVRYQGKENEDLNQEIELKNIPKFKNFPLSNESIMRSVAASWYLNQTKPLLGQEKDFAKNARIFIDREQPLIPQTNVKEAEIKLQEQKLKDIRLKIQAAIKELENMDYMSLEQIEESEKIEIKIEEEVKEEKSEIEEKCESKEIIVL